MTWGRVVWCINWIKEKGKWISEWTRICGPPVFIFFEFIAIHGMRRGAARAALYKDCFWDIFSFARLDCTFELFLFTSLHFRYYLCPPLWNRKVSSVLRSNVPGRKNEKEALTIFTRIDKILSRAFPATFLLSAVGFDVRTEKKGGRCFEVENRAKFVSWLLFFSEAWAVQGDWQSFLVRLILASFWLLVPNPPGY